MIIEILMPALSPTMTEGTLAKWHRKEGDKLKPGELIAEIETDKATMEVEAVEEGIIGKILINSGVNNVPVGSVIALLIEEESDRELLNSYQVKIQKNTPNQEKAEVKKSEIVPIEAKNLISKDDVRIVASPLAKRIAADKGIDLKYISGSGPRGRIVKQDVEGNTAISRQSRNSVSHTLEPLTNMRRVIAKRLVESKQTVPHFYLNIECNLDKLLAVRADLNSIDGYKISVNDFIIKATAMALAKSPEANSSWSEEGIIRYNNIDVAVAVAISGGLVTPILKNADQKTLLELSNEMKLLAAKAKEGKLTPEEYQGGSFSISNLGMFGIKEFAAIINPPQSCILAVGAGIKAPAVVNGVLGISTIAQMTLSCDHRVVDGAVGAKFLSYFKDYMENPIKMFV